MSAATWIVAALLVLGVAGATSSNSGKPSGQAQAMSDGTPPPPPR
jgi:hypothetical protein